MGWSGVLCQWAVGDGKAGRVQDTDVRQKGEPGLMVHLRGWNPWESQGMKQVHRDVVGDGPGPVPRAAAASLVLV